METTQKNLNEIMNDLCKKIPAHGSKEKSCNIGVGVLLLAMVNRFCGPVLTTARKRKTMKKKISWKLGEVRGRRDLQDQGSRKGGSPTDKVTFGTTSSLEVLRLSPEKNALHRCVGLGR